MTKGLSAEDAAQAVGVARATLYRWEKHPEPRSKRPRRMRPKTWMPALVQEVERLRLDHPMWGRAKLGPILRCDGFKVSDATVGRIIAHLVAHGVVESVPLLRRRKGGPRGRGGAHTQPACPRATSRTRQASSWPARGQLVQVDTLSVNIRPDRAIKQFTAYDPVARHTAAQAFSRATAQCAAAFLNKLLRAFPFPVSGIQVDGGSEFMADFERACAAKNLALFVLPPKRPQLNGAVERAQSSWRYEFYACHDLPHRLDRLNERIDAFAHLYNHHRPHGALGGQTPAEYLNAISQETPPSQMC